MKRYFFLLLIGILLVSGCASESYRGTTAFIKENTVLYDSPDGRIIRNDLTKGRVVTVINKQGSWVAITIYTYDTPIDNRGWVRSNTLAESTQGLILTEGRTRSELVLMDGPPPNGKRLPDKVGSRTPIQIIKRQNGWVHGMIAGGLDGWLPESNIEFMGPSID